MRERLMLLSPTKRSRLLSVISELRGIASTYSRSTALLVSSTSLRMGGKAQWHLYTPVEGAEYIKVEAGNVVDEALSDRDRLRGSSCSTRPEEAT